KGGPQPADLFPAFGGLVSGLEGTAALAGTLRWTARTITPDVTVTLKAARSTSSLALTRTLSPAGPAIEGSAISVPVPAPDAGLRNPAVARVKKLSVQPQAAGGQRIVIEQGTLAAKDLPWSVQGLGGDVLWQGDKTTAKFAIDRVTSL